MRYLEIEKFRQTKLETEPFNYLVVPRFLKAETLEEVDADYPAIDKAGNFPLQGLTYGPRFKACIDELKSEEFRVAIEEKFSMDLEPLDHLVSIRAFSHKTDGHIHTDAAAKVLTALIYLNADWDAAGGRLRLLRNKDDIEDYVAEVPPVSGTLLMFKRADNSWHGHKPFVGPRRTMQINWVTDAVAASKQYRPMTLKRRFKRLIGLEA